MGTGLVSTKGLSVGLPFDFFIYLITAVQLRTKLGLGKIIHLIADTHALGTQNADGFEDKVSSLAQEQMNQLKNLAASLGLSDIYEVQLASSIRKEPQFKEIVADLAHI